MQEKVLHCIEMLYWNEMSKKNDGFLLRTRRIRLERIPLPIFMRHLAPRVLVLLFHRRRRSNHRRVRLRHDRVKVLLAQWERHLHPRRLHLLQIHLRTQIQIHLALSKQQSITIIVSHLPDSPTLPILIPRCVSNNVFYFIYNFFHISFLLLFSFCAISLQWRINFLKIILAICSFLYNIQFRERERERKKLDYIFL